MLLWVFLIGIAVVVYVITQAIGPLTSSWDQNVNSAIIVVLIWVGMILFDRIQKLERRIEDLSTNLAQLRHRLRQ